MQTSGFMFPNTKMYLVEVKNSELFFTEILKSERSSFKKEELIKTTGDAIVAAELSGSYSKTILQASKAGIELIEGFEGAVGNKNSYEISNMLRACGFSWDAGRKKWFKKSAIETVASKYGDTL
nr:MAG TPA: hypothetical protein [Caudoviricetes sp.]